jgi:hypothetical protein
MSLKPIPLPVNKPGVPLGGVPTVTMQGSKKLVFHTGVYIDGVTWTMVFEFSVIYAFRYLEEDHIDVAEFIYGIAEVESSPWIKQLSDDWVQRYKSDPSRAFGREPDKVHHYRVVYLENGMYEVVCKNLKIEIFPPA